MESCMSETEKFYPSHPDHLSLRVPQATPMVCSRIRTLISAQILGTTFVSALLSSGIVVPLYNVPGRDCSNWSSLLAAIPKHPNIPFLIVINPEDGPGPNSQPDSEFVTCIPRLSSGHPSVTLVGYVVTNSGRTSSDKVIAAVKKYSNWNAAYRPSGIYFDQTDTSARQVDLYRSYASAAKDSFGPNAYIAFESDENAVSDFFTFSSLIVTISRSYNSFSASRDLSSGDPSKQGVILSGGPSQTPQSAVEELVMTRKVGRIFITDAREFERLPSDLEGLSNAIEGSAAGSPPQSLPTTDTPSSDPTQSSPSIPGVIPSIPGVIVQTLTRNGQTLTVTSTNSQFSLLKFSTGTHTETSNASSTPSQSTASAPPSKRSHINTAAIVAGVVVPLVLLAFCILYLRLRRRRAMRSRKNADGETPTPWVRSDSEIHTSETSNTKEEEAFTMSQSTAAPVHPLRYLDSERSFRTDEALSEPISAGQHLLLTPVAFGSDVASPSLGSDDENTRLRQENSILREQAGILAQLRGLSNEVDLPSYPGTPQPHQQSF